ncbi:ABC transporter ATP-binding protein [endosymbiont of Lamellibrachia barhami]|uniref:ABC transporter ATP-binding protein n=1 Tax=endosymbiont of Lamellibrachia barhami TaxID=205975 RepID=UPI0015B27BF2|nr:ABC transporter ATP-binding protein [endosymbiont of Lamellibrachia barhami]
MVVESESTKDELVIDVQDLVTYYGTRKILDQVNLQVLAGEIMVIMGGSGSGKSTLLRHMLALNKPAAGAIRLFGKDPNKLSAPQLHAIRQRMGVSFQNGALFNSLNVEENVAFPLREHTRLDENTIRIMARMKLEVVNLAGFEKLMPSQLSGGMVKRAALARAIVMDPSLLFFDEPSAGLDPVVSADLDELILRLRDAMKVTIVVVTHELDSAFRIADRILVLDKGKVLILGTVDEVKSSDNKRVQNLLNRKSEDVIVNPDEYLQRLTDDLAGL